MQKVQVPITNFQFGEVSPSLSSRTDTAVYTASAQKVENMFIRAEGGVIKRAGLQNLYKYTDITYNSTKTHQARLIPFIFSDDEQYIVSLESEKVRVFIIDPSTGAVSLTSTITVDIFGASLPFSNSYLHEYTFAQTGDVLFICHPLFMPRQIIRTSLTTFEVDSFVFDSRSDKERIYQPYYNFQKISSFLTPSGTTSSVTLKTSDFTATADPDGISVSASVSSGSSFVIGGALTSDGVATFDTPRIVTITSAGNDSSKTFLVTGTDNDGRTFNESITGASGGTATGSKFFKTVTGIGLAANASTASTVTAGVTDESGVSYFDTTGTSVIFVSGTGYLNVGTTITLTKSNGVDIVFTSETYGSSDPSSPNGFRSGTTSAYDADELATNITNAINSHADFTATKAAGSAFDITIYQTDSQKLNAITIVHTSTQYAVLSSNINYHPSTFSGSYPNSKHIGITLLYHESEILITSVESSSQATGTVLDTLFVQLKANALKTISGSTTVEVTHVKHGMRVGDSITLSDCASVGNISTSNINGSRTILGVIDDNHYTFTAGGAANASIDGGGSPKVTSAAPTTNWAEQSYSQVRGFPSATTFHQNRLCFAGTIAQPDTIWMSKSASYYNFDTGDANDSDSIHLTASIGEVQQIRHLVSNRDLQVFTASSEMYVPAFQDKPITPTNAQVRRQTPFGSDFIRPQVLDGATVFIQSGGAIVREYLFTDTEEAYTAVPVSSLSSHLIDTPVEMNTFYGAVDRSESYVFVRNASGKMAVFNSNRAEQRAGWAEFTSQGLFHSTVTIDDRVFANVAFPMGDDTTRYVLCEFKADSNMDMAKTYTATSSNNGIFTVSSDFENGAVVNVVSGNNYIGEFTVAGGVVNVSAVVALNTAEIGYKFDVNLRTNPIDTNTQSGPVSAKIRSLASVVVDLNNTLSVSVNNTNLVIRQVNDDLSQDQNAFTGRKEFRLMGYGRTPQVTISQSAPLPLQVNGLIAELVF